VTGLLKVGQVAQTAAGPLSVRALFGSGHAARPGYGTRQAAAAPGEDPTISALKAKVAALTVDVLRLQSELETVADAAYEDGRTAAVSAYVRDEENARAALAAGIGSARSAFETALGDMHRLAIALAQTAVAKMLGDMPSASGAVEAILRTQLARLRPEAVIAAVVSAHDFKTEAALQALRKSVGGPELAVQVDPQMPRGGCRIELRLGHLDAGLDVQWANLATFCETLAAEPGGRQ